MIEIKNKADCCGCGACENICPVGIIKMMDDEEGFLFPSYNRDKCINCGACERVCPIINAKSKNKEEGSYQIPKAFGGWIKDDMIRYDSSSGGAFSLFANYVLSNGGVVYGASLGEDLIVRHIAVESTRELTKLRGSKYVQSTIGDTYSRIKENLKKNQMVLFSGTPCQAAGLYSFLGNKKYENLYIIDFICHGVPSPKVFSDYLKYLSSKHKDKIVSFKFRLKDRKWNPTGLQLGTGITTSTGKFIRHYPAFRDPFMNGFLDDSYLRLSCYDCKFKTLPKYYSDITIADFWGVDKCYPELNDGKGTSLILINGEHGEELFEKTKDDFHHLPVDFNKAIRRNKSLIRSAELNTRRARFFNDYKRKPFKVLKKTYMNPFIWGIHKVSAISQKKIEGIIKHK